MLVYSVCHLSTFLYFVVFEANLQEQSSAVSSTRPLASLSAYKLIASMFGECAIRLQEARIVFGLSSLITLAGVRKSHCGRPGRIKVL